jgi:hypothetical protein
MDQDIIELQPMPDPVATPETPAQAKPCCDFCGDSNTEAEILIMSGTGTICAACIEICFALLVKSRRADEPQPPTEGPPE